MVLVDARGLGTLAGVWKSLKDIAAANPDVPTVLLIVAKDVDAISACAVLTASPKPTLAMEFAFHPHVACGASPVEH